MADLSLTTAAEPTWTALKCRLADMTEVWIWHVSETRLGERTTVCGALLSAMDWILGPRTYAELGDTDTLCRPCALAFGKRRLLLVQIRRAVANA